MLTGFSAIGQEKNLEDYIRVGLSNSPFLKDLKNQQLSNAIDSMRLLAGYKPQVNGLSYNYYAPSVNGWGYDVAITNGTNVSQLVVATQKLVSKQNLANQQEAIRLLNESLTVAGKISEQDLKRTIGAQYITAYGDVMQLQFNRQLNGLLHKEEQLLKTLTQKGVYRQTDYLSFLVNLQQQELLITQLNAQYKNDIAALNYVCGIRDTNTVTIAAPIFDSLLLPEAESSVFYRQFDIDSLKLKNQSTQIAFNYKPKVSLYADGGFFSSFAENAYKNFGVSAGVSITVPIYDGKQKKMQFDKINIAEQTRQYYRDYFKTQYQQQVAQLYLQLNNVQQVINEAARQLSFNEALIEANRKLLQTGDLHMPDYILAIANYMNTKNIITQNSITRLQLLNQINYFNRK
ncbi:MAG: TolC family protein [Bacteroidota bacterium]|nr:TolC family protein [Bacteroidota bacterium]